MKSKGKTSNSSVNLVVPWFTEEFSLSKVYSEFVGEYVGKTLLESKRQPIFVIRKVYQSNGK